MYWIKLGVIIYAVLVIICNWNDIKKDFNKYMRYRITRKERKEINEYCRTHEDWKVF